MRKSDPTKASQASTTESKPLSIDRGGFVGDGVPPASTKMGADREALYRVGQQEVSRVLEAATQGKPVDLGRLQPVVIALVAAMRTGDELQALTLGLGDSHLNMPRHMVNVTILGIKIAQGIGYAEDDLRRLALAASLHDVGMVSVPRRILEKPGALSPDEAMLVREHPETGFRILQALGPAFDWVATVALQEHEREDGNGYPRGLRLDQIHEYAKIVGLADTYEAMTHRRLYQKQRAPFDAMKEITSLARLHFSHHVLKGFIQGLSAFPVGSLVRLNSKDIARVIATDPAFPLRPVVEVFTGALGEQLSSPRRIDLTQNSLLYITDSVTSDEARGPEAA